MSSICKRTLIAAVPTYLKLCGGLHNHLQNMADKDYDSDESEEVQEENLKEEKIDEPQEDTTLANPDVVTKYQEAAKIAQAVLLEVIPRVSQKLLLV